MTKIHKKTNRPLVLISVMLAMFVGAVEATIVTTAMPSIASEILAVFRGIVGYFLPIY